MSAGLTIGRLAVDVSVRELRARGHRAPRNIPTTDFDPLDPAVRADPYPAYRALLAGPAVQFSRRRRLYVISHHEAVRAAGRAHDALSSAENVARLRASLPMMLSRDRPDHTRLRGVLAAHFTRATVEARRPLMERLADAGLTAIRAGDDAVRALAVPLPVAVIGALLGVPDARISEFHRWSDGICEGFTVEPGLDTLPRSARVLRAVAGLHAYVSSRRDRGDDLLGLLQRAVDAGELSADERFWAALMLLVAGNETTTNLIGSLLLRLTEHPDQYALLRGEPGRIDTAIDEALRHDAPIQGLYRTAVAAHAGIPTGGRVLLLFGAANRDPRQYAEPDRFDITRDGAANLAFGSGIHFCLGSHLARLEARVVLERLLATTERLELAGPVRWTRNPNLRGPAALRLRLAPGP